MRFAQAVISPIAFLTLLSACADGDYLSSANDFPQQSKNATELNAIASTSLKNVSSSGYHHSNGNSSEQIFESFPNNELLNSANMNVSPAALRVGLHDKKSDYSVSIDALTSTLLVNTNYPYTNHSTSSNSAPGSNKNVTNHRSINNSEALRVEVTSFDAIIDRESHTFHLQNDFKFELEVTNENGQFSSDLFRYAENPDDERLTGNIVIEIPADTKLMVKKLEDGDGYTEVTKVESGGPMMIRGTHFFSFDQSIAMGECFIWEDDYLEFGGGFERVACPL